MLKKLLPIFALTAGLLLAGCTGGKGGQGGSQGGSQGGGEGSGGSQGGGGAQTVEIVSQMGDADSEVGDVTKTVGAITVTWNGVYKHFDDNNEVRVYAGKTITISGATISSIAFTFANNTSSDKGGPNQLSGEGYTYTDGTKNGAWSGSATSITLSAEKQAKITGMTISYVA